MQSKGQDRWKIQESEWRFLVSPSLFPSLVCADVHGLRCQKFENEDSGQELMHFINKNLAERAFSLSSSPHVSFPLVAHSSFSNSFPSSLFPLPLRSLTQEEKNFTFFFLIPFSFFLLLSHSFSFPFLPLCHLVTEVVYNKTASILSPSLVSLEHFYRNLLLGRRVTIQWVKDLSLASNNNSCHSSLFTSLSKSLHLSSPSLSSSDGLLLFHSIEFSNKEPLPLSVSLHFTQHNTKPPKGNFHLKVSLSFTNVFFLSFINFFFLSLLLTFSFSLSFSLLQKRIFTG